MAAAPTMLSRCPNNSCFHVRSSGPDSTMKSAPRAAASRSADAARRSIASLASAWFLKSALARSRREIAERASRSEPAAEAGVVPLARTVVLAPQNGTGPAIVRVARPAGRALLLVFPRTALVPQATGFGVALARGGTVVWDSGDLPAKGSDEGDLSLRLPPGVPPAGAYAVRLRSRTAAGEPRDALFGTLDIEER